MSFKLIGAAVEHPQSWSLPTLKLLSQPGLQTTEVVKFEAVTSIIFGSFILDNRQLEYRFQRSQLMFELSVTGSAFWQTREASQDFQPIWLSCPAICVVSSRPLLKWST